MADLQVLFTCWIPNLPSHFQVYVEFMEGQPWRDRFNENVHSKPDIFYTWMKLINPVFDFEDKSN
jgi:hypothetical protein